MQGTQHPTESTHHRAAWGLAALTLVLMMWGAATRAARAGLACPDWPLCHGQVIPPWDAAGMPANAHSVGQVWMEFVHRVLALGVVGGVAALWRPLGASGKTSTRLQLVLLLGVQVMLGAVTVWMGNAPWTVVLHLGLALAFLGTTVTLLNIPALGFWPGGILAPLVAAQMLVGAKVSASLFGLACADFPLCQGQVLPAHMNTAVAWQLVHRALGLGVLLVALVLAARHPKGGAPGVAVLVLVQVVLGALNVWWGTPVWLSALHLGVAALIFAVSVQAWGRAWIP